MVNALGKAGIFFISSMMLAGLFIHNPTRGYFNTNRSESDQFAKEHSIIINKLKVDADVANIRSVNQRQIVGSKTLTYKSSNEDWQSIIADSILKEGIEGIEKELIKPNPNKAVLGLSDNDYNEFMQIRKIPLMQWRSIGAIAKPLAYLGNIILFEVFCLLLFIIWSALFLRISK
jgi:hypothetical protein